MKSLSKLLKESEGSEWFNNNGIMIKDIPEEAVDACGGQGNKDQVVDHWVEKLDFNVPRELAIKYLKEFGAWEDLKQTNQDTLNKRVFWIACNDIAENGEWFGLQH